MCVRLFYCFSISQIAENSEIQRFKSPKLTKFRDLIPRIYTFLVFFAIEIEMFQNYFEVLLDA